MDIGHDPIDARKQALKEQQAKQRQALLQKKHQELLQQRLKQQLLELKAKQEQGPEPLDCRPAAELELPVDKLVSGIVEFGKIQSTNPKAAKDSNKAASEELKKQFNRDLVDQVFWIMQNPEEFNQLSAGEYAMMKFLLEQGLQGNVDLADRDGLRERVPVALTEARRALRIETERKEKERELMEMEETGMEYVPDFVGFGGGDDDDEEEEIDMDEFELQEGEEYEEMDEPEL